MENCSAKYCKGKCINFIKLKFDEYLSNIQFNENAVSHVEICNDDRILYEYKNVKIMRKQFYGVYKGDLDNHTELLIEFDSKKIVHEVD